MLEPLDTPRPPPPPESVKRPKIWRFLVLAGVLFGILAVSGILGRNHSDAELAQWTDEQAIPTVDLVTPTHATEDEHLTLPADVEAFYTAPIHARVNGYVKMWFYDIGARVKAGAVLAKIDTPDLDQQYEQAKGQLAKAQADYNLAMLTAERWKALRKSQAVSQQTADEKMGDAKAREAEVTAAQANLERYKSMLNFKDITAPFNGIVTARRIDVGALVSATNSDQPGLFDVASTKQMRVYVRVPQVYAASMHKDMKVSLTLPQYSNRVFTGTLDTTSNAISQQARALLVEVLFDNPNGALTPGAYAQARFSLPLDPDKLVIPAGALVFRNNAPEVAVVSGRKVTLKPIKILLDTGTHIEVGSGLSAADRIVASPYDSIASGDTVDVRKIDGKRPGKPIADTSVVRHEAHE